MQATYQRRWHLRGWQGWHIRVFFEIVVVQLIKMSGQDCLDAKIAPYM